MKHRARLVRSFLRRAACAFILNDRPDIAAIAGAAGVHVGQEDFRSKTRAGSVGAPRWVGVSTHNLEQLRAADRTSADYIAVGPIFPTGHKGES